MKKNEDTTPSGAGDLYGRVTGVGLVCSNQTVVGHTARNTRDKPQNIIAAKEMAQPAAAPSPPVPPVWRLRAISPKSRSQGLLLLRLRPLGFLLLSFCFSLFLMYVSNPTVSALITALLLVSFNKCSCPSIGCTFNNAIIMPMRLVASFYT